MRWIFLSLLLGNLAYLGYQLYFKPDGVLPESITVANEEPGLQLLSERKGRSPRDIEVEEVLENPISVASDTPPVGCNGLGPFDDVIAAQNVTERFNAVGFMVDLRAVDVPTGEFDYRVVLPPLPSLQEAFRKLRELKSRDIDSYVISQGEDSLGISLGVFSTEAAAQQHQKKLTDEGYVVDIKEIPRVNRGYWLFGQQSMQFPVDLLDAVAEEYVQVKVTETACLN